MQGHFHDTQMGLPSTRILKMHWLLGIPALSWAHPQQTTGHSYVFEFHWTKKEMQHTYKNNKNLNLKVGYLFNSIYTDFFLLLSLWVNWGEKTKSSFQHYIFLGCYFHLMASLVGFDRWFSLNLEICTLCIVYTASLADYNSVNADFELREQSGSLEASRKCAVLGHIRVQLIKRVNEASLIASSMNAS